MTNTQDMTWKSEFREQFNGKMCDGAGDGIYYELEPEFFEFIETLLHSKLNRQKEHFINMLTELDKESQHATIRDALNVINVIQSLKEEKV